MLSTQSSSLRLLFQQWGKVDGPLWTDNLDLLPSHLTAPQRAVALQELRSIPEHFYTGTKLPIITPGNYEQYMTLVTTTGFGMFLFSLCSGSSRLLLNMVNQPFEKTVLFPVDLRYGWDLLHLPHRKIIATIDLKYKPLYTTIEPRCKYWSKAGNRRDPAATTDLRESEKPMLTFLTGHALAVVEDKRGVLVENPRTSALWTESAFNALNYVAAFEEHSQITCQCGYTPQVPDGERHRKETMLKASFPLRRSIKKCFCQ